MRGCATAGSPRARSGPDGVVIPPEIIDKPPSAELREDQKDEDSLPPYPVLDAILHGLVEKEMRVADIVAQGYDLETVRRVERLLYLAEYKRRQSAPGREGRTRRISAATAATPSSIDSATSAPPRARPTPRSRRGDRRELRSGSKNNVTRS